MCGDWNLNFMLDNIRIQEIKNPLESHNSINMYSKIANKNHPSSESLIDVIVTNKDNSELGVSVVDLGFSDHLAQVVKINTSKGNRKNKMVLRRQLTNNNTEEFKNLLSEGSWNKVFNHSDVNSSLKAFMDIFLFCLETTIPYKRQKLREIKNNSWLTKGLINSSKRMKMLNNLKREFTLIREDLEHIKNIKKCTKEYYRKKKKKDNDRYVTEASNKTKAMWQSTSRKIGKTQEDDYKLELKI